MVTRKAAPALRLRRNRPIKLGTCHFNNVSMLRGRVKDPFSRAARNRATRSRRFSWVGMRESLRIWKILDMVG